VFLRAVDDGTFVDEDRGVVEAFGSSNAVAASLVDYDNDGDLDLFTRSLVGGRSVALWRNDGAAFTDATSIAGIEWSGDTRGFAWGDVDNDGDLDLFIASATDGVEHGLYINAGDGTFSRAEVGTFDTSPAHGVAFVDYDNDGDLDLAIARSGSVSTLYQNQTNDEAYLMVHVVGAGRRATNAAGVGVRVDLFDTGGTLLATRVIGAAGGWAGQEPLWAHFGGVDPAAEYVVRARLLSGDVEQRITPGTVSSQIGATNVPQLLTIVEPAPPAAIVGRWREVSEDEADSLAGD
jgi:hypothetical protein